MKFEIGDIVAWCYDGKCFLIVDSPIYNYGRSAVLFVQKAQEYEDRLTLVYRPPAVSLEDASEPDKLSATLYG